MMFVRNCGFRTGMRSESKNSKKKTIKALLTFLSSNFSVVNYGGQRYKAKKLPQVQWINKDGE